MKYKLFDLHRKQFVSKFESPIQLTSKMLGVDINYTIVVKGRNAQFSYINYNTDNKTYEIGFYFHDDFS